MKGRPTVASQHREEGVTMPALIILGLMFLMWGVAIYATTQDWSEEKGAPRMQAGACCSRSQPALFLSDSLLRNWHGWIRRRTGQCVPRRFLSCAVCLSI